MKRLFPFILLSTSCFLFDKEEANIKPDTNLNMSIHSVGVTSVNLNITPDDTTATYSFEIDRNGTTVLSLYQISNDTLVNVGGLEPNTLNTLTLNRVLANTRTPLDTVSFTTMDTTTSQFGGWIIDTIGVQNSEVRDVHMVNENDIYIVGDFSLEDSADWLPTYTNYNFGHWDGNRWVFSRVFAVGVHLQSITYFSENDIWVTPSSVAFHWDGNDWTLHHMQDIIGDSTIMGVGKDSWGTSSNNMYFVGGKWGEPYSHIIHYDGSNFYPYLIDVFTQLIEIEGTPDGEHIIAVGHPTVYNSIWAVFYSNGDPTEWERIDIPEGIDNLCSVDIYGDTAYLAFSDGVWKYNYITGESQIDYIDIWKLVAFTDTEILGQNDQLYHSLTMDYLHNNGVDYEFNIDLSYLSNLGYRTFKMDYNGEMVVQVGIKIGWEHGIVVRGYK